MVDLEPHNLDGENFLIRTVSDLIIEEFPRLLKGPGVKGEVTLTGYLRYRHTGAVGQGDPGYLVKFFDTKMNTKSITIGGVTIKKSQTLLISDEFFQFLEDNYWEHDEKRKIEIEIPCIFEMYLSTTILKKGKKQRTLHFTAWMDEKPKYTKMIVS